jgi:hypothetical protein
LLRDRSIGRSPATPLSALCVDAKPAELKQAGAGFIHTVPALSVFFKPRLSGTRYLKEGVEGASHLDRQRSF